MYVHGLADEVNHAPVPPPVYVLGYPDPHPLIDIMLLHGSGAEVAPTPVKVIVLGFETLSALFGIFNVADLVPDDEGVNLIVKFPDCPGLKYNEVVPIMEN